MKKNWNIYIFQKEIEIYICVFVCVCVCAQWLNHVWLFATPWTLVHQAPLSMGFSRQEYWSGLPFPNRQIWAVLVQIRIMMPFLVQGLRQWIKVRMPYLVLKTQDSLIYGCLPLYVGFLNIFWVCTYVHLIVFIA